MRVALSLLLSVCVACGDEPLQTREAEPRPGAADNVAAAAAPSPEAPDAGELPDGTDTDAASSDEEALRWPLTVWPLRLPDVALDAVARHGPELLLATRQPATDAGVDPDILALATLTAGDDAPTTRWHAAVIGASPVAMTRARARLVAAWTQAAWPGRDLGLVSLAPGEAPRYQVATRPEEPRRSAPATPVGRPLLAAVGDAVIACAQDDGGGALCTIVAHDGAVAPLARVASLSPYHPFAIVPVDGGAWLFAADCDVRPDEHTRAGACKRARLVLQPLDAHGAPRRELRHLLTMQVDPTLAVLPIAGGALLTGRRRGATDATAFIVEPRRVRELEGAWNRTRGGVQTAEGALLLELETLTIAGGFPRRGFRPRRLALPEERLDPRPWPAAIAASLPGAPNQQLLTENGVVAMVAHVGGALTGVAVAPEAGPPPP